MELKPLIQGFLLFMLFLIGYGLYGQSTATMIPADGKQLFFYVCLIIATALGRNVDKVLDKLITFLPSRKDKPLRKS